MIELTKAIPDVEVLLSLQPEELAAKLLFLVRKRDGEKHCHPGDYTGEIYNSQLGNPPYPPQRQTEVELALAEAWAWLKAQGLIVAEPGINGQHGFHLLSRRARQFEDETAFLFSCYSNPGAHARIFRTAGNSHQA